MDQEKIGSVVLDYRFYPGEDRYSDGEIEDEMLELAGSFRGDQLEQEIAKRANWPVLYHFSHIRENILSWLPLKGTEHVLEVGSGLGAVTGALAERAAQVTCIDLSKKRSRTNALRHSDQDNIRILVGNFQDIAGHLEEKFDLITLIGVFEYAQFSISSDQPFLDYLMLLKGLLVPGGRIVIAIENRLGLKYWAGASEDHTGIYYEGLEGYPATDYVRTFSRPGLEALLKEAGLDVLRFRYPYPDYKLPDRIYSDRWQPSKGDITGSPLNFDRERMMTFDEGLVTASLVQDGLYPIFANSFFVEAGYDVPEKEKESPEILFSRFSVERDASFRVRTDIVQDPGGKKTVRKYPGHPRAEAWIRSLPQKQRQLERQLSFEGWKINRVEAKDGYAELEWVDGVPLDTVLDQYLKEESPEKCKNTLYDYLLLLEDKTQPFHADEKFARIFGAPPFTESMARQAGICSDLDLIPSNIMILGDTKTVIDYEWTFDFAVPAGYLQYRMIHYYVHGSSLREKSLDEAELLDMAGISEAEAAVYRDMEDAFQRYILGGYRPIWTLYEQISDGVIPVLPLAEAESIRRRKRTIEVFFDDGDGFRPEKCRHYHPKNEELASLAIRIPEGTRRIRIDPGSRRCVVRILYLKQGKETLVPQTNGKKNANGDFVFDTEDPQIILTVNGTEDVKIRFQEEEMKGILRDAVLAQSPVVHRLTQTKLWKTVKERIRP